MITIRMVDDNILEGPPIEIPNIHGPALRSALTELRDRIGSRLAASHRPPKEAALTRAMAAVMALTAGLGALVLKGDPDYE